MLAICDLRKAITAVTLGALLSATWFLAAPDAQAAYPGANGALYFSTGRPRPLDIWWVHPTLGLRPMPAAVNGPKDDWSHYWSPDGSQMLFQSTRDRDSEIYLWDSAAATVTQLTRNKVLDTYASWSPPLADGKMRIVYQRKAKNNMDLWIMNADGTGQKSLFGTRKDDVQAAWSPQGDQIAFASAADGDSDIYLLDVALNDGVVSAAGPPRNVTNHSPGADYSPDWSPTGTELVFVREPGALAEGLGNSSLWRMNVDGTGETFVIDHQLIDKQPDWSPDGTTIAFASGTDATDATWDIWTVDVNGGSLARITDDDFGDFQPEWRNAQSA